MEETRVLAILLVASIVVSLGGTYLSLNKLGASDYTGMVTADDTGTVDLTVSDNTQITFTAAAVDFGSGYVTTACNNCTTYTNSTGTPAGSQDEACCADGWNTTTNGGLVIENTGNTNVSLNLNSSKAAATFLGGSAPSPEFQWWIKAGSTSDLAPTDDTTEACGGSISYSSGWTNVLTSDPEICASNLFKPLDAQNELVVDFRLVIPKNAPTGAKTVTLTATGDTA